MKAHFIEREELSIAFFSDTKRYFRINERAKNLIQAIQDDKICKEDIMNLFNINSEEYEKYESKIFDFTQGVQTTDVSVPLADSSNKKRLSRLVIHVTNDCNLRCKYCYANGGSYLSQRALMTIETFDKMLKTFYEEYDEILNIQFFGGEPLLNIPLIKYACEQISNIACERNYSVNFGIVTNGTIMNEEFIDLVKKYKIMVTVSYDGYIVNDIMRIYPGGAATSEVILANTKKLLRETGQPNTIEVTYTQYHVEKKQSIVDVVKHIQTEFPGVYIHLVPAGGEDDCDYTIKDLSIFADSVNEISQYLFQNKEASDIPSYSLVDRVFSAISSTSNNIEYICDAGVGTNSVSVTGDIYTCFMFTDQDEMRIGNVYDADPFYSKQAQLLNTKTYSFVKKSNNDECKKCFIKNICSSCLGLNSFHSGDPFALSSPICKMYREMAEEALYSYALNIEKSKINN